MQNEVTDEALDAAIEAWDDTYEAEITIGNLIYTDNKRVAMRAALEAALSAAPVAGKVKPLQWVKHPVAEAWRADTMLGTYQVWVGSSRVGWQYDGLLGEHLNENSVDVEAAQAAAQADYERRLLSALEPAVQEGWRDISSAPKDGASILVVVKEGVLEPNSERVWCVRWAGTDNDWYDDWLAQADGTGDGPVVSFATDNLSLWMPLPASPTGGAS